jgi:hypothetical protein
MRSPGNPDLDGNEDEDYLYEVAVLKGDEEEFGLCYDTHIANDVVGSLSKSEVYEMTLRIKELPPTPEAVSKSRSAKIGAIAAGPDDQVLIGYRESEDLKKMIDWRK